MTDKPLLTPAEIKESLEALDQFLFSAEMAEENISVLAEHLVALNSLKRDLGLIYDSFSALVAFRMRSENLSDVDLSEASIQAKTGYARKSWNNKSLLFEVYNKLQQSSVDMDTGEVMLSTEEIVLKLLDYLQPSYWRVKALSDLGINADNYCEVGEAKTNIAVYTKGSKNND